MKMTVAAPENVPIDLKIFKKISTEQNNFSPLYLAHIIVKLIEIIYFYISLEWLS